MTDSMGNTTRQRMFGGRGARLLILLCSGLVLAGTPAAARATLDAIRVSPEHPTTCGPVALSVEGTMPDPCYHIIGTVVEGPTELPTMGPIPTYEIKVRITVQEPNPALDIACPTVLQPYQRILGLGLLRFGGYFVNATEYLVPFSPDSSAAPKDSSLLSTSFDVAAGECPPGLGCYMLSFGPTQPRPSTDPVRVDPCDARSRPGGTACFDVLLQNETPVGGVQTEIVVFDPRLNVPTPAASDLFQPISVEAVGRAGSFKVAWSAEGSRAKILLFSSDGAAIGPGRGAILHVCYSVSSDAPEGRYPMRHQNAIVADPDGNAMMPCPTFAEIAGSICVIKSGCDLNGDGISNIQDVILLAHCALAGTGGSAACPDSVAAKADCNGDGSLDIRDVICCVRRILSDGGFGSGGSGVPWTPGTTRIGFAGRPAWVDPTTGRATVEIEPGTGFAGIQFAVNATGGARVQDIALAGALGEYSLEWSAESGSALAMLYRNDPGPLIGLAPSALVPPLQIVVTFEAIPGTDGASTLSLEGVATATFSGSAAQASIESGTVAVPSNPAAAPAVSAPAPNPFASETAIHYVLATASRVTVRVYNVSGRLVRTLVDTTMPPGAHTATWNGRDADGRDLGSGIYFVKFAAGGVEKTNRLLKLR